jgi:hypothetical protein
MWLAILRHLIVNCDRFFLQNARASSWTCKPLCTHTPQSDRQTIGCLDIMQTRNSEAPPGYVGRQRCFRSAPHPPTTQNPAKNYRFHPQPLACAPSSIAIAWSPDPVVVSANCFPGVGGFPGARCHRRIRSVQYCAMVPASVRGLPLPPSPPPY